MGLEMKKSTPALYALPMRVFSDTWLSMMHLAVQPWARRSVTTSMPSRWGIKKSSMITSGRVARISAVEGIPSAESPQIMPSFSPVMIWVRLWMMEGSSSRM